MKKPPVSQSLCLARVAGVAFLLFFDDLFHVPEINDIFPATTVR